MNDKLVEEQVQFEGCPVRIGNREYVLPSLSVGQAERLWPKLLELDRTGATVEELKSLMPSKFDDMVTIIHAALSRNYKDITAAQLKDVVSIGQLKQLMLIVSGQSGLQPGEQAPVEPKHVVH